VASAMRKDEIERNYIRREYDRGPNLENFGSEA
jgi:hypothetical protein